MIFFVCKSRLGALSFCRLAVRPKNERGGSEGFVRNQSDQRRSKTVQNHGKMRAIIGFSDDEHSTTQLIGGFHSVLAKTWPFRPPIYLWGLNYIVEVFIFFFLLASIFEYFLCFDHNTLPNRMVQRSLWSRSDVGVLFIDCLIE